MTVEEIEIIVTAKVEEALKEFEKFLPTIKQVMKQVVPTYKEPDEVNKKIVNEKKETNENTQKVEATANT